MKKNIRKLLIFAQLKILFFIYVAILSSISAKSIYSMAFLETTVDNIDVSYNARLDEDDESSKIFERKNSVSIISEINKSESENNNLNIPVSLRVHNDNKSYQLAVSQIIPFENPDINIICDLPSAILDSGDKVDSINNPPPFNEYLLMNPLQVDISEQLFFTYDNPEYNLQTFDFLFNIQILEGVEPGNYSSLIKFSLYQDGISMSEIEVRFNIVVQEYFIMEIIFLDSTKANFDFGFVSKETARIDKQIEIQILSNMEKPYRIIQKRSENMKSSLSDLEFYLEDILFEVDKSDLKGNAYYDQTKSLEIQDDVIYESDNNGSSDTIPVTYSLQNHGNFKAGDYDSTLSFYVEDFDKSELLSEITITCNFLVNIEQYFFFNVYPENNSSILDFTPRMLEDSNKTRILKVEVFSNTGKPYIFSQSLPNELVNAKGGILDNKQISFLLVNNEGEPLLLEEEKVMTQNNQVVYESNALGDSNLFYIKYQTSFDKTQNAGFYRSDIQFSLSDD